MDINPQLEPHQLIEKINTLWSLSGDKLKSISSSLKGTKGFTLLALIIFILAKIGLVPSKIESLEIEILLFIGLALAALIETTLLKTKGTSTGLNYSMGCSFNNSSAE